MLKKRYLIEDIQDVCFSAHKMAFISGPRQCGKTTLAKQILKRRGEGVYYNWDEINFRRKWAKNPSQITYKDKTSKVPVIILDEIHKAKSWKKNLKGIYDSLLIDQDILVTGSAKLNVYKKGSDSLLGRYYHFRLHPFSFRELYKTNLEIDHNNLIDAVFSNSYSINKSHKNNLESLYMFGPFPEPLLSASTRTLNLWQRGRIEKIIREDLRDLSRLPELSQIEMLVALLPERASNILSITSLSEDLEAAYTTVKRWLNYLKELYYHFEIKPYAKNIVRAIKKESKIYLWDWTEIEDDGARFENLIAFHLLKYVHYLTDTGIGNFELRYLRNKEKKEIDFLIIKNKKPWLPIEVNLNQESPSENWKVFLPKIPCKQGIQIIKKSGVFKKISYEYGEVLVISADLFLNYLI